MHLACITAAPVICSGMADKGQIPVTKRKMPVQPFIETLSMYTFKLDPRQVEKAVGLPQRKRTAETTEDQED